MTKRIAAALFLSLLAVPLYADFADIARAIDRQHGVKRVWIPFLGLARFAVRVVAPEGVHDFQLATFDGARDVDPRELQQIMRAKVGPGWTPIVQVRSRGDWSFIYARPSKSGDRMELMILAHDSSDTVLVRVEVDTEKVARELRDEPRRVSQHARR